MYTNYEKLNLFENKPTALNSFKKIWYAFTSFDSLCCCKSVSIDRTLVLIINVSLSLDYYSEQWSVVSDEMFPKFLKKVKNFYCPIFL